jgi:hypothetical protein
VSPRLHPAKPRGWLALAACGLCWAACTGPKSGASKGGDGDDDANLADDGGAGGGGAATDGGAADGGAADGAAADGADASDGGGADGADGTAGDSAEPLPPLPWDDAPCERIDVGDDPFAGVVATYTAQDEAAPPPSGGLLVAGSSSVRRWRSAARSLSAFDPLQRGVGGARAADLALHAEALIVRHRPAGLLLFAGTNDVGDGRPADQVLGDLRCIAEQLHAAAPGAPLLYIGITPTPARWSVWSTAAEVNASWQALSALHPSLHYIDVPAAFLARGEPPEAGLFLDDGLHLSPEGYALWESVVLPAVAAALPAATRPLPAGPPPGSYIRVDLGPSNPEDGAPAPSPDGFGIHWNSWHPLSGGQQAHAGEALRGLRTTTGAATAVDLVLSGGFRANGLRNGGLSAPPGELLGTMAVPEATGDFFYAGEPDDPAGITLSGLDPAARYTLRLFSSRADAAEVRRTGFVVFGAGPPTSTSLTTTGAGVGAYGYDGNNREVAVLTGLVPDARGRLHLELDRLEGSFLYLNLLELEAEAP